MPAAWPTKQAEGMGEGFADFHALLLLVKDEDRAAANAGFGGAYPVSAYAESGPDFAPDVLSNAWYYGIRRYPYSRDMTKNPLTFRHIGDGVALPAIAAAVAHGGGRQQLRGAPHRRGLGLDAVGVLRQPARRPPAAVVRAGAGADEALPGRRLQDDALEPDVHRGARRDPRRDEVAGSARPRPVPARLRQARRGRRRRGSRPLRRGQRRRRSRASCRPADRGPEARRRSSTTTRSGTTISSPTSRTRSPSSTTGASRLGAHRRGLRTSTPTRRRGAPACAGSSAPRSRRAARTSTRRVPSECGVVRQNADWQLEGVVFGVSAPGPDGACPAGMRPVYRLYNDGQGAAPTTATRPASRPASGCWREAGLPRVTVRSA